MHKIDRHNVLILTIFFILLVSTFAAATPLAAAAPTIMASKPSYTIGETITVSGTADRYSLISIQVFDTNGVRKAIAQATADSQGRYSSDTIYKVAAGDPEGTWTVKAYQGGIAATATFDVVGLDVTPPTLSISVMPEKKIYKDENIHIALFADEDLERPTVEVAQKGTAAKDITMSPVKDDLRRWSGTYVVTVGYDGPATIEILAKDLAGNRASATASIKVDTTPPMVTMTAPTRTEEAEVEVSGIVDDPEIAVVEANVAGLSPTIVSVYDGKWSTTLTLPATGTNTITAKATDLARNVGTVSAIVIYAGPMEVIADRVKKIEERMAGLEEKVESGLAEAEAEMADTRGSMTDQMEETRSTIEAEMDDTRASIASEMAMLREQLVGEVSALYMWVMVAVILCLVAAVAATLSVVTIARKIVMK